MTDPSSHAAGAPSRAELRKFGLSTGIAFAVIFGLFLPWLFSFQIPRWPYVLGVVLVGAGLAAPMLLKPVFHGWMWLAVKIGAFNSRVLLGLVFYVAITPVGLVRRLFGRDPLGLRASTAATYRKPSRKRTPASQERPF